MTDLDLGYLPSFLTAPDAQALCAEIDGDVWFPEVGGSSRWAKQTCNRCELLQPCGEWAITNAEPAGIWGGLTPSDRKAIRAGRSTTRKPASNWTTPETRAHVIDLLRLGWSAEEIAREVGISSRTVHRIRVRHELESAA